MSRHAGDLPEDADGLVIWKVVQRQPADHHIHRAVGEGECQRIPAQQRDLRIRVGAPARLGEDLLAKIQRDDAQGNLLPAGPGGDRAGDIGAGRGYIEQRDRAV